MNKRRESERETDGERKIEEKRQLKRECERERQREKNREKEAIGERETDREYDREREREREGVINMSLPGSVWRSWIGGSSFIRESLPSFFARALPNNVFIETKIREKFKEEGAMNMKRRGDKRRQDEIT